MRKISYEQWVKNFDEVIDSPHPRRTTIPLRTCKYSIPYQYETTEGIPSVETLKKIFSSLVKLRHSRCAGRLDCEVGVMTALGMMVGDLVFLDRPNEMRGKLFPDHKEASKEESDRNLLLMKLIGEFAFLALKDAPKKEKQTSRRVAASYEILEYLIRRKELNPLLQDVVDYSKTILREKSEEDLSSTLEFIDSFYIIKNLTMEKDFIKDLQTLSEKTKDEGTAFVVNNILVDIGEINQFTALDRMEDFRENF